MKTSPSNPLALCVLLVSFCSIAASRTSAQTFTTLRNFTGATSPSYTNADGYYLNASLLLADNRLYGLTKNGGAYGNGVVFALNSDGTAFTNLHSFAASSSGSAPNIFNLDGAYPQCDLILSGDTLYGTAPYGGTNGNGTVFAVNTDGSGFTLLHTFTATSGSVLTNSDGASPFGGLAMSGNTLFGTTVAGGKFGQGTVFALTTDGASFTNLHDCSGGPGASPYGGLVLSSNTLFGTTLNGGRYDYGTVFAINTDGSSFTNLHSFRVNEGVNPFAGVILSGNMLYGTTQTGGPIGYGTVFALNVDGTTFTNLHSFNQTDGWEPQSRLLLSGNTLFGTATYGGIPAYNGQYGNGTLFAINTDGSAFTNLHKFTRTGGTQGGYGTNSDGGYPVGGLIVSGNTLIGTTHMGGSAGSGTIFTLSFTPHLTLTASGSDFVIAWPTNYLGFDFTAYTLQSTTDLGSSPIWTTNSPTPVVLNGQLTTTNPMSATHQFFRLHQ